MHLFNLATFGQRYGIDMTVSDFYDAVAEASKAATNTVASMFRFTDFDEFTQRRDVFQPGRMFAYGHLKHRPFLLSRGFIDADTGFSAVYTENPVHVRNNDPSAYTDLQDIDEDNKSDRVFIDAEQGVVNVYGVDLSERWVVITYNGGLSVATDDEYEGVPSWLSDAAEAQAILQLKQNRTFQTEDNEDLTSIRITIDMLLGQHGRYHISAAKPVMSNIVT